MKVFNTAVQNIDITELEIYFAEQQLVNKIIEKTGRLRFDHCGKSFLILCSSFFLKPVFKTMSILKSQDS